MFPEMMGKSSTFRSHGARKNLLETRSINISPLRGRGSVWSAHSFCPLKDASRTKRLVPRQHESGLFVMMIRINDCKRDTVHESFFGIPSYVEEGEFHTVTVRRGLPFHARPVPGVTIMRQEQAVSVHINHRDRIVRNSTRCHLVKDCVTSGCHPNGRLHGYAHHASLPGSCQTLQFLKRLLCVGLWARRFRHRHLHLLWQRDGGRRNKDD